MSAKTPAAKTISRRTLVIALVVVVTLLVGMLVGGEVYARHTVSRCISTQFEKEMGSKIDVGFGWKPLLITWVDGKVSEVTIDSNDTKFGPAVGMVVHARFNDVEVKDSGRNGGTIGSSSADITWNNEGIRQTLAGTVSGVHSSASSGMLTLDVLGGIAQLQLHPTVQNGKVQVETESAQLLGVGLPTDLVQGIVDLFSQSLQSYPLGLQPTDIKVTDNGIAGKLSGGHTDLQPATNGNVSC